MTYKYRVLLVLVLSVLIFCSQYTFGQTKLIQRNVIVKDSTLKVELKTKQAFDCQAGPGSISISVSGGSGVYSYVWTGPAGFTSSSKNISGLAAGTYHLTVIDGSDCSYSNSWDIASTCSATCVLKDNHTITDASACNAANGSVNVTVSGGSGNYNYTWFDSNFNHIGTSQNLTAKLPGYYILFVEDNGKTSCGTYFYYTIKSGFKIVVNATPNTSCKPPYTGTITPVITGGSGNYSYRWTLPNGVKKTGVAALGQLHGGNYQLQITDNSYGCTLQQSIYILNPSNGLSATTTSTPNSTCSLSNGAANIAVSGGSGNYLYSWSNLLTNTLVGSSKDLKAVPSGQYNIAVNDTSSFCVLNKKVVVDNGISTYPSIDSVVIPNTNCSAPFNGAISITSKNVDKPLYSWSSAGGFIATTQNVSGLEAGAYYLIVTDSATGCTASSVIVVDDKSLPNIDVQIDNVSDARSCTKSDGSISVSINSASTPYTLSWAGPDNFISSEGNIAKLAPGTYVLTVSATCNRAPVITPPVAEVTDKSTLRLNLLDFITDADNNLDLASIAIVDTPTSGAEVTLQKDCSLMLNYKNVSFTGTDNIKIRACDLMKACSENIIAITVDSPADKNNDIIVYNAVSANHDQYNSFLRIENVEQYDSKVTIYNRWGDQVFRVENYDNNISCKRFEGISNEKKELPTGTYFYKIEFTSNKPTVTGYLALEAE